LNILDKNGVELGKVECFGKSQGEEAGKLEYLWANIGNFVIIINFLWLHSFRTGG
jgi:hypothetical protein